MRFSRRQQPEADPLRVVVSNWMGLGDLIQLTSLLRAIREANKRVRISLIARDDVMPILDGSDLYDDSLSLPARLTIGPRTGWTPKDRAMARTVIQYLQDSPPALGIIWDSEETAIYRSGSIMRRAGVPRRVGYAPQPWVARQLTEPLDLTPFRNEHGSIRLRSLCDHLGLNVHEFSPDLALRREERQRARDLLTQAGIDLTGPTIAALAGADHPLKDWPIKHQRETLRQLLADGLQVVLVGGPELRERGQALLQSDGPEDALRGAVNLVGQLTLRELAAVVARCDVFLLPDSDMAQIATAVGTAAVALFGPTSPRRTGPVGTQHQILTAQAECSPCEREGHLPRCPHSQICMTELLPEDVAPAVRAAVANHRQARVSSDRFTPLSELQGETHPTTSGER